MAVDTLRSNAHATSTDAPAKRSSVVRDDHDRDLRRRGAAIGAARELDPVKKRVVVSEQSDASAGEGDLQVVRLHDRVADAIETVEVQVAVIALIVFDVASTVVSLLIRSHHEIFRLEALIAKSSSKKSGGMMNGDVAFGDETQPSAITTLALRLLGSLAGFTIVVFTIELAVLAFTFRRRFLSHFGYMLDALVVGLSIALEIYTESMAGRMLGLLRVWRVFRLVGTLLQREQRQHEVAMDALEIEQARVLKLEYEKQAAEQSLKRELESRAGIERMLQGYKDEADTLREALTIAAQAVAEATMQVSIPEGDEEAVAEASYYDYYAEAQDTALLSADATQVEFNAHTYNYEAPTEVEQASGAEDEDAEFADALIE